MFKLPFRYALSAVYAKLIIEDIIAISQSISAAGWYHLFVFADPAVQYCRQLRNRQILQSNAEKIRRDVHKKLGMDQTAEKIVKEVCVDFNLGEIKVIMWNKMNAGYVFRRIYLPAQWREFLTEDELKAIIGHELGHQKLDSDAMIPLRIVNRTGDEVLFALLPVHLTGSFLLVMSFISQNVAYLKLLALTFFFRIFHLLMENYFARKDEFQADQYGTQAAGADTLKRALQKIDRRARLEIFESLHQLPHFKQVYYHWLLKKDRGFLREALLDHPFLHRRIEALNV